MPIFVPAFSDCSAGFGLIHHQWHHPGKHLSIDSAKDFLELTKIKIESKRSGLLMIGGGVPKNFAQDTVVAADYLGFDVGMHKYAVQITVADDRDGALSGSTLKEANSWGKVDLGAEQMVYAEATLALPLVAGYAYHKGNWKNRQARDYAETARSTRDHERERTRCSSVSRATTRPNRETTSPTFGTRANRDRFARQLLVNWTLRSFHFATHH